MGRDLEPPCFLPAAPCPVPGVIIRKDSPPNPFSSISVSAAYNAETVNLSARTKPCPMILKQGLKSITKIAPPAVNALMFARQKPC